MSLQRALTQVVNKTFAALGPLVRPATYEAHTGLVFRNIEEGFTVAQIVEYPLKRVAFTGFEEREIDNEAVLVTDQKVIFPAAELPVEPLVGDTIRDCRGSTFRIIRRYDSAGSLIVRAQVRLQTTPTREISAPPPPPHYCPPPSPKDCKPIQREMKPIYWGVCEFESLTNELVHALQYTERANSLHKSITYLGTHGDFLWYVHPTSFGRVKEIRERAPSASQTSISVTVQVVAVTDDDGRSENYYAWRVKRNTIGVDVDIAWS